MTTTRLSILLVVAFAFSAVGGFIGAGIAVRTATSLRESSAALAISTQHRDMVERIAKDLREQTAVAVRDRFASNAAAADKAHSLASRALAAGDTVREKIYLLNALQHHPGHAQALAAYVESATAATADSADAARAQEVLTVAAFAVPPEQVESVLALAERVDKRLVELELASRPKQRDLAAEFRAATAVSPEVAWKTPAACDARFATLADLRVEAVERFEPSNSIRSAIEVEHDRWSATRSASVLLSQMNDCLANFNVAQPDSEMAFSALRAAETFQHALRSLPVALLPKSLVEAQHVAVQALDAGLKRANATRSAGPVKKILELRDLARSIQSDRATGTHQVRSERIANALAEAGRFRGIITDESAAVVAGKAMDEILVIAQRVRRGQHAAYQIEALNRIGLAWTRFKKDTRVTSEADALEPIFYLAHGQLIAIDQRLLDPEVAQQFQEIWMKLWAELEEGQSEGKDRVRKAEIQLRDEVFHAVPFGRKLRLEDF